MDFVSCLRTILRLSPDVIFIGEIRDAETARVAIQASLTGHLVISTIHSRTSVGAIYRLLDLGIEKHILNYALRGILSQRLLRKVCDHCKQAYAPTKPEIDFYTKEKGSPPLALVHGTKCDFCRETRYSGRVGTYELLEMNDSVRELLLNNPSESEFSDKLKEQGFKNMQQAGLELVDSGITSIREYIRTVYDAR
jgi:type II secretory ATPase GspE/PulE/Tfp pilus assembly ATPase PilB-like protein